METEAAIREWVLKHRVTWEVGPWQELADQQVTTVGFELRLFGQHEPHVHASAGCDNCVLLFERLRAIARAALPNGHRPTTYEIQPSDASLHHRPESGWTPEVQLTVHIVHREDYLRPVDGCERRCAEEIQNSLRALGVQPKSWPQTRRDPAPEAVRGATEEEAME